MSAALWGTARAGDTAALRELLRQSQLSGAHRRAVVLHTDRLPVSLAKPHHLRLAREALLSLTQADRAQIFELAQGRIAIVWRSRGGDELAQAQQALSHLLSGQPAGAALGLGEILTQYDLPDQAVWLLDELADGATPPPGAGRRLAPIDARMLARLESSLARADLSPFARWRAVRHLPATWPAPADWRPDRALAWEERLFAVHDLAASLCPDYNIRADPWLFRRLTRSLDSRMLAMLSNAGDARGSFAFAIHLNVATILAPEFLRFDEALNVALRGQVTLFLRPADLLADPAAYSFARNFARARFYRLGLAGMSLTLLELIDVAAAGLDVVQLPLTPDLQAAPDTLRALVPPEMTLVLTGLDRPSDVLWAIRQGFKFGRGRAFAR